MSTVTLSRETIAMRGHLSWGTTYYLQKVLYFTGVESVSNEWPLILRDHTFYGQLGDFPRDSAVVIQYNFTCLGNWNRLRDHCLERPPVLKDHTFLAEGLTFQCNWTCHQRPHVLTDHIFVANGWSFKTGSTVLENGLEILASSTQNVSTDLADAL